MFRQVFILFVALIITSTLRGQETFRQYFGQPYSFSEEEAFSIEKIGNQFVLVGLRENAVSQSEDIAFWFFDPATLELTDSTVIALPEDQGLYDTYAGPDGGLLIVYERERFSNDNDYVFRYYGPDGNLAWENELTNEVPVIDFENIRDITFKSTTELVLTFSTFGTGDELGGRLATFTAATGFVSSFVYGEPGTNEIWSIEHQDNGDLLIAGGNFRGEVFVALLEADGTVKWENVFEDVEGSFGSLRYDFLSDAHRPANDTIILVTGSVASARRAFIVMDTLGNRLEEYDLEDFTLRVEGKEQARWIGDSLLFINNNTDNYASIYPLEDYAPNSNFTQVEGNSDGFRAKGSFLDENTRQVFTASDFFGQDGDAGIVRFGINTLDIETKIVGTTGTDSEEEALALELQPDGSYLLLTRGINTANSGRTNFLLVDSLGQPTDTLLINDDFSQFGQPGVANVGQEDVLLLFKGSRRWQIYRYTPAGALLWSTIISGISRTGASQIVSLADGRFAGRNITQEQQQVPPFGIIQTTSMLVADSTGTVSDTVSTIRLNRSKIVVGSQNDLVFAGNSYPQDSVIILSQDITGNNVNWEYTAGFSEGPLVNAEDIVTLADGTYAVVVAATGEVDGNASSSLHYLRLSAAGEELVRKELVTGLQTFQSPVIKEGVAGEVTIAYGAGESTADGGDDQIFELAVQRLTAATGEELLRTAFQSPFSATAPVDVEHLADGRTAIIANAMASDTSASDDVLFLVFDTEGNVTNLRSTRSLEMQLTVSPNPTADQIYVALEELPIAPLEFSIYDVTGRRLQQGQMRNKQTTIELGQYPAGSYFLLLRSKEGGILTRQVIRQ